MLGCQHFNTIYNLLRILYVVRTLGMATGICMIISYNKPGHLLTDVVPASGGTTYIVL